MQVLNEPLEAFWLQTTDSQLEPAEGNLWLGSLLSPLVGLDRELGEGSPYGSLCSDFLSACLSAP